MFLGIDVGTSGVKAVLIDERGDIVAQRVQALEVQRPHALWSEQQPNDWWNAVDAARITSFTLGRFEGELPISELESITNVYRGSLGFKGDIGARWKYDVTYGYGQSNQELRQNNLTFNRALYASVDAVRNASGQIVCRSTLQGLDAGCVPRNLFGPQPVNDALNAYLLGDAVSWLRLQQHVASFNVSGDLGDTLELAGPISVAAGLEYRKEKGNQRVDAVSDSLTDLTGIRGFPGSLANRRGGWRTFNPAPFVGAYDIKEGYVEIGLPVLKDVPLFRSLDLNGAVRYADYSQSGGVTTWKVGGTWDIVDGLRLRSTYSRDIRAPNLIELYSPGQGSINNLIYRGVSTQSLNIVSGNLDLVPERAKTLTVGAVAQPAFLPGLEASVDYYRINIDGAIENLGPQRILDQCAAGNTVACALFSVTSSNTLVVNDKQLNLSQLRNSGIDAEVSYRTTLAGGALQLRLLGNHGLTNDRVAPGGTRIQLLGSNVTPKWSGVAQVTYKVGQVSLFAQERYIGKSKVDPSFVDGVDISVSDNSVPAVFYTDATLTFDVDGTGRQFYVSVANLFNKTPPLSPPAVSSFSFAASPAYDQIGRYFTVGFRVRL